MSNTDLIIEERPRDIGDFLVGRLLPFYKKRMVGPFIFVDHMGPSKIGPGRYMDIDQHPHIGLATLSWLIEGEIEHRDSVGSEQSVKPGAVNLMIAGKGVAHTERTPMALRDGTEFMVHGYQIWIALPEEYENMEPEFHHVESGKLPKWEDENAEFTLIAGNGYGKESPVPVFSDLFMVEVKSKTKYKLETRGHLKGEIGICIVEGKIQACEHHLGKGNMLVSKREDNCTIEMEPDTHLLLFGGLPFEKERFIDWNFVSVNKNTIIEARQNWEERKFPKVPNDNTYIPLPRLAK